nr:MAG TPA: hypothetical protein [Caudoviricetes sp.]
MSYVIYDIQGSNIVTGFSEEIREVEDNMFHDVSNDVIYHHQEYSYAKLDNIPRYITQFNYTYSDSEGFKRIRNAQDILNERKAMFNTMKIRLDTLHEAKVNGEDASDAICEMSVILDSILDMISAIENRLDELEKK